MAALAANTPTTSAPLIKMGEENESSFLIFSLSIGSLFRAVASCKSKGAGDGVVVAEEMCIEAEGKGS